MASILDASLLSLLSPVFALIFVFLVVYSVLEASKVLGENKGVHALLALMIAFFVALTPNISRLIIFMSPWFVVMIVFIVFMFMIGQFSGLAQADIITTFGGKAGAFWWIVFFSGLILTFGLSNVFGQQLLQGEDGTTATVNSTQKSAFANNVSQTLFHPKLLGLVLILLIASFTVRLMATKD